MLVSASGALEGARALLRPGLLSLGVHGLLAAALALPHALRPQAPPIPIEVRSYKRVAPRPPAPPSPPAAPAPSHAGPRRPGAGARASHKPGPPPRPPEPPSPPQPPSVADLRPFAPGDARLMLLLRADRLRASPHRAAVEQLLGVLPDYHTLLGGSGLKAIDDLDALLLATANPFDVTATFLAARHPPDGKVRAALARRTLPSWDPRTLRYPEPTLTLLARPALPPPRRSPDAGVDPADDDPAALEARWLNNLTAFQRAAGDRNGPALLVDIEQLGALVYLTGGLPTPLALSIAATGDAAPLVRARAVFADEREAAAFAAALPTVWRKMLDFRPLNLPGFPTIGQSLPLEPLLLALKPEVQGAVVELVGQLPAEPLARLLALVPLLVPHAPDETAAATPAAPDTPIAPAPATPIAPAPATPIAPAPASPIAPAAAPGTAPAAPAEPLPPPPDASTVAAPATADPSVAPPRPPAGG